MFKNFNAILVKKKNPKIHTRDGSHLYTICLRKNSLGPRVTDFGRRI